MQETLAILPALTLTTALTGSTPAGAGGVAAKAGRVEALALQAVFTYGSGGTTCKAWVQTSLDGGTTWFDIASFAFTTASATRMYNLTDAAVTAIATPGDAALADNTSVNGFLGPLFRVKITSTGTYAGSTTLTITAVPK